MLNAKTICISLLIFSPLFSAGQKSVIFKNVNVRAQELRHHLNVSADSLMLDCDRKIFNVEVYNTEFSKELKFSATSVKMAIDDLPLGRYSVLVRLRDKIIVFTLLQKSTTNPFGSPDKEQSLITKTVNLSELNERKFAKTSLQDNDRTKNDSADIKDKSDKNTNSLDLEVTEIVSTSKSKSNRNKRASNKNNRTLASNKRDKKNTDLPNKRMNSLDIGNQDGETSSRSKSSKITQASDKNRNSIVLNLKERSKRVPLNFEDKRRQKEKNAQKTNSQISSRVIDSKAGINSSKTERIVEGYWVAKTSKGHIGTKTVRFFASPETVNSIISRVKREKKTRAGQFNTVKIWEIYNTLEFKRAYAKDRYYLRSLTSPFFNTEVFYQIDKNSTTDN